MVDVTDLNVHDVRVFDQVSTLAGEFGKVYTFVNFFVGSHGPFQVKLAKDEATGEKISSAIDHQVAQLRKVTGVGY